MLSESVVDPFDYHPVTLCSTEILRCLEDPIQTRGCFWASTTLIRWSNACLKYSLSNVLIHSKSSAAG